MRLTEGDVLRFRETRVGGTDQGLGESMSFTIRDETTVEWELRAVRVFGNGSCNVEIRPRVHRGILP